ncbi:MAG TPA: class I SAM-dependent methyltransferase, partial [Polyangiaceae bacterium]|nr:class I SAM-dependent methyltransferase [Polyangiaceae bacterium]
FQCTLVDLSEGMLGLSRGLNSECEHLVGDIRSVRLERTFDAVLVHDAVMYMTTEEDLLAAIRTAFAHTRAGGAAIFAPDALRDTFRESTQLIEGDDGARALRGIEWKWDPDPNDDTFATEYSFLLRNADGSVDSVHDRHTEGLFARATWIRLLTGVGYRAETIARPLDDGERDEIFLCRKP